MEISEAPTSRVTRPMGFMFVIFSIKYGTLGGWIFRKSNFVSCLQPEYLHKVPIVIRVDVISAFLIITFYNFNFKYCCTICECCSKNYII